MTSSHPYSIFREYLLEIFFMSFFDLIVQSLAGEGIIIYEKS